MLSAGVWAYGTNFTETSCISAMEAQASGLEIISSSTAALKETVGDRGVLLDGDCNTREYQLKFIENVVSALNNPQEERRVKANQYATQNFGLEKLAENWSQMLYDLINSKEDSLIIPYQPTESFAA
jgi:glycosyltransferase involved in cell wall biosynthesis